MGIGGILAYISYKLTLQSTLALMGKSIPKKQVETIRDQLENDSSVRAVFDVKCTYVTPNLYRLKAEVEFDGRQVGRHYLESLDEHGIQEIRRKLELAGQSDEETRKFLLEQSERMIDQLGRDIDRIETSLKDSHKDLRHIDLELN